MSTALRILLVDDNAMMRAAIRGVLRSEPGFDVVGEAADGAAGVGLAEAFAPDVVLMDVEMPGGVDGVEATRQILAAHALADDEGDADARRPIVIALSGSGEYARQMRDAGAAAFVAKDRAHELLDVIRDAVAARAV